jgi:hypothetical protein
MANLLMESDYSQVVSLESLESELRLVRAAAAGSVRTCSAAINDPAD